MIKGNIKDNKKEFFTKSKIIKLFLKKLTNQYNLKEVINCVFSSKLENNYLKKLIDSFIEEEGLLNIIHYLLHLEEPEEGIQEIEEKEVEKLINLFYIKYNINLDIIDLNEVFEKDKNKFATIKENKIQNENEKGNNHIEEVIFIEEKKEDTFDNNIQIKQKNKNERDITNILKNDKYNDNKIDISKIENIGDTIIEIEEKENKKEEKKFAIKFDEHHKNKINYENLYNKEKNRFNISEEENEIHKMENKNNKKEENINSKKNPINLYISNNEQPPIKIQEILSEKKSLNTELLLKKRKLDKDLDNDSSLLKFYYSVDNEKFYKYRIIREEKGIANIICDDKRCKGKGTYIFNDKSLDIVSKHNILNSDHSYVQKMSKIDKEYFENMKRNKKCGLEVILSNIK